VIRDIDDRAINPQYRVIGGTGIVWADFDATVDFMSGKTETIKGRSIHVFTKSDGKWFVAAAFRSPRE
jgi:hypothetical protein